MSQDARKRGWIPWRDVVGRFILDAEGCFMICGDVGTARRLALGRTAFRKLVIVPDMVVFREGIADDLQSYAGVKRGVLL